MDEKRRKAHEEADKITDWIAENHEMLAYEAARRAMSFGDFVVHILSDALDVYVDQSSSEIEEELGYRPKHADGGSSCLDMIMPTVGDWAKKNEEELRREAWCKRTAEVNELNVLWNSPARGE